ncbi:MAG: hypothetical protein FWD79_02435 [Desulfobulbus sp.]|nr:hypothetical protein [Desulfobulbus sp.]
MGEWDFLPSHRGNMLIFFADATVEKIMGQQFAAHLFKSSAASSVYANYEYGH